MTKREFMELSGKSVTQTRKLCDKGEFQVPGLGWFRAVKTGTGKTSPIDIRKLDRAETPEPELPTAGAASSGAMQKLREAKISVDIQLLRQRLAETQQEIERRYQHEVVSALAAALEPLRSAFRNCKLNREQAECINHALNESLKRVKSLLNG